jgi:hypothetical protein
LHGDKLTILTSALLIAGCGGHGSGPSQAGPLKVLAASPDAQTYFPSEPLRIHFDQPVIDAGQIGVDLGESPVMIEPEAELDARFVDRQTLLLTPKKPLARSTHYKVSLRGDLEARTGGFSYEFVSVPLEIEGIWGIDLSKLGPEPELPLHFNQDVAPAQVTKHCSFLSPEADTIAVKTSGDTRAVIEVRPAAPLALDAKYQLVCAGLSGEGGTQAMAGIYSLQLATYPKLHVASITPSDKGPITADRTRFELVFSTPMDREALRENMVIEPKVDGIDHGWLGYQGTRYSTSLMLAPRTEYTLTVKAGAADSYGQKLGADYVHRFTTGDAPPAVSMESGIYALEPHKKGYSIWTRNIKNLDVECAEVPAASAVKLLTSGMDYDPWYNAEKKVIDWSAHGLRAKKLDFKPAGADNKWNLTRIDLGQMCAGNSRGKLGLYLAEVKSPDLVMDPNRRWAYRASQRVLANVTDIGVLLKVAPQSGVVWTTSISTGKPLAGARVSLYSTKGKRVFTGTTRRDGILNIPGSARLLKPEGGRADLTSYRAQRMIAVVEKGGDRAVVDGNWTNGIQTWNFGVSEDRSSDLSKIRGFIQSDRGIYRPGEMVRFKGLLREYRGGRAPTIPRGERDVDVEVRNSRGAVVFKKALDVTRFGGFAFDHSLSPEAPTGDYVVTAKIKGQSFRERFFVEEFRKVNFEIGIEGIERHQRLGQKLSFAVKADYLFGAPVSGGQVKWDVQRRSHMIRFPRKFPSYGFADYAAKGYFGWWWYDGNRYGEFVADGEGRTDSKGAFGFAVADKSGELTDPYDYIAQVSVTDDTDQQVTKRVVITAHPSEFYFGLHAQEWVQAVDMPFAINAVAVRPDGGQIAQTAKLSFIREQRVCSWEKRAGSYGRSYPECENKHEVVESRQIKIPASGVATERLVPKKPGDYIVRIEGKDPRGAVVSSSTYLWVLGKGENFWSGDESARMTLIASKTEYEPGETAKLVPRTGLKKPTALVTLERAGVLTAFVKEMESPYEGIRVPLEGSYAPNVFASVAMVSGRHGKGDRHRPRFKMGVVDLRIKSDHKKLAVEVITEKKKYEPGDKVAGIVRVKSNGRPVSAEVAVSAADEGVLQLIGYKTPDPMQAFYASWGLGADNATNWNRIARHSSPTGKDPDEGGDSGSSKEGVRSKFVNSAYWAPSLVTDGRGEARFEFTAPDNLSAFRIMAVAADTGDRFGSSDSRITVAKPLLAKPVLPRFLTQGDKSEVGVVVHNYTGQSGKVTIDASGSGVALTPARQTITLGPNDSQRVRFYATAAAAQMAGFQFKLAMGRHRDGVKVELPIGRPLVSEEKVLARGNLGGVHPGSVVVDIPWSAKADGAASLVTVSVDRLGMSELEPALRHLIEYPYGCLEQTLSRFIPLTKVEDLAASLDMEALRGTELARFLRAGADKVVRHQQGDGHYSLWPAGATYPHLTVYATYGLLQAKNAGVRIDEAAYRRGLRAMRAWATKTVTDDGATACTPHAVCTPAAMRGTAAMAAYLLAVSGQPDKGLNAKLYQARASLPFYGRGFLLMAMHHARADKQLRRTLFTEIADARTSGLFRESFDQRQVMGSDVRSTAIVLQAMLLEDPRNEEIDELAAELKKSQKPTGYWGSTQDNTYALIALADYARRNAGGTSQVTVKLGGDTLESKRLAGGAVISVSKTRAEAGSRSIEISARGRAVYTVRARQALPFETTRAVDAGMTVTRELLDPETNKPVTSFTVGQVLLARVTVKSDKTRHWVALVDPLPAGFEPVNTKLATARRGRATAAERSSASWHARWDHIELRDDEVRAFRDHMRAGETTLTYRVRASMPGEFSALPAHVEQMYEPEVMGRSVGTKVVVRR